jgi:hypothetical protein
MLLNEIFGGMPLFESGATVQLVVNHIKDIVPNVKAIWLQRVPKGPWNFLVVVDDFTDADDRLAANDGIRRIERGVQGVQIKVSINNVSGFVAPEGAMKIFATQPVAA